MSPRVIRAALAAMLGVCVQGLSHAEAGITVFTDRIAFDNALVAPAVDTFDDLSTTVATPSPTTRSAGTYGYRISSQSGLFGAGPEFAPWLSTNSAVDTILIDRFSGGVFAVGGLFFGSDSTRSFQSAVIEVTVTDRTGSVTQTTPGGFAFIGFTSTDGILSLSVRAVQPDAGSLWPTVNNLVVGTIPSPAAGCMLLGVLAIRRRR